jgi:hydrogenase maturation protease
MSVGGKILLIGYGNPGRGDDGLGPALADRIAALALPGMTVDIDYQLTVDHAALIATHDLVVFADAMIGLEVPCRLTRITGPAPETLGSHQVSPEAALALAALLFGYAPQGWVLAIAGVAFGEVREGLSPVAQGNLVTATEVLLHWIATQR